MRKKLSCLIAALICLSGFCNAQATNSHPVVAIELADGITLEMVQVTNGFYIGKFEVTQAQWTAVMKTIPFAFSGTNRPAEYVSWNECQAFISKLNSLENVGKAGLTMRLPTEEEWEYCCRCGKPADEIPEGYSDFESYLKEHAWYSPNCGQATHDVGTKKPNSWGIYDMHGNVIEICGSYLFGGCVIKGGGWVSSPKSCISTHRYAIFPFQQYDDAGFRVAGEMRH